MNVKQATVLAGIAATITFAGYAAAQAPAGSTGTCNDGSYTTAASKSGACSGHGGVKDWYPTAKAAAPAKTDKAATTTKAATTDKAATTSKAATTDKAKAASADKATADKAAAADKGKKKAETAAAPAAKTSKTSKTAAAAPAPAPAPPPTISNKTGLPTTAAPGGGRGKVWVNTDTNVYHCQGDRWYGMTLKGEYMSEAEATAKGARPPRGKTCS